VKDGWHVNAHVPHEDFLVPTIVTLARRGRRLGRRPRLPEADEAKLAFSESPLAFTNMSS